MANHQLLDNITHRNLRVITDRSAWYGDDIAATLIFPLEFRRIQSEYPIAFQRNAETRGYEPIALFGFEERENLYLGPNGWDASYIPLTVERQPFLIGFKTSTEDGVPQEEPVVHVDMDSPRVSETEGVPVFLEHGGQSPYLEHITRVLHTIHEGYAQNRRFSEALTSLQLLEPFSLEFEAGGGARRKLSGLYTLNEERLNGLDAASLESLHCSRFLESIYMVMASIGNFRALIERRKHLA
ncbi:MAG: hypothetical protein AMJ58_11430 [Gammaproteobacteria bacterium SG8_30]|nr:MAG: hypothetical protein AMJ58_11430 [Gammaproteobacteria bacterium SG8_30]